MQGKFEDLTDKTFGRWKIIMRVENNKQGSSQWLCECECEKHTRKVILGSKLNSGRSLSCGCLRSELNRERFHFTNKYELSGEYGIGYTTKGEEFYFDLEDYDKIKDYCWHNSHGYIKSNKILMHVLVMGEKEGCVIDHIYGNTNDNRKKYLRHIKQADNSKNSKIKENNSSGYTGVCWSKSRSKWRAYIFVENKQTHLGYYDNIEEARKKRIEAEKKYYGEYAPYLREVKI